MKVFPTIQAKNTQIIKFIIERLSGHLGRTHLLKLIYMSDYHARKLFGNPMSTFDYHWHNNGPFDRELYNCIDSLKDTHIREEKVYFPVCTGYVFHNIPNKIKYDSLSEYELYVLEYVIKTYGKTKLQTLLEDVVYETEPMKALEKFNDRLPMEIIDNKDKDNYEGVDPKDIIAGEKAVQDGNVLSLEEVFGAIQSSDSKQPTEH